MLFGLPCWTTCLACTPLLMFQRLELALVVTRARNGALRSDRSVETAAEAAQIFFQPTGLRRLFALPGSVIVNEHY